MPATATALPKLKVSQRGATRLKSGHVWVYRSDIVSADGVTPGSLVTVTDPRGKTLGTALYSSSSQIAVRLISHDPVVDLPALIRERIAAAITYREAVVRDTNAYRVIFSEADFLPGMIVDRYNDILSLQILTQAMDGNTVRETLISELTLRLSPAAGVPATGVPTAGVPGTVVSGTVVPVTIVPVTIAPVTIAPVTIVERVDPRVRELETLPPRVSGRLQGTKTSTTFTMNQIQFYFDALEGQKTGAFLDQRENYAAAAQYAHGEALDVFCYQGGFALHLAPRCSQVTGVDSSRPALEVADRNAALNGERFAGKDAGREIEWIEANAFDLLKDYAASNHRYDTIVLDPPAFAKSKRDLDAAMRGYKELNLRVLKMLRPGGILVTCSCSYHVSQSNFLEMLASAALDAHRTLRLLEIRGQAKDHPILLNVPETCYLKCVIAYVS
ncbi:MAG TPA: class I SAM-dependent rRNA methyltransferase [Terriglobales bacterium]|nr:class I SAM-dependent rRNA methyltransferase [Terriglobales bacterium]